MNRTVGLWTLLGLAVACCWVVVGLMLGPSGYNLGHSSFVAITAPASLFGRRAPLGLVPFILLNGFLYMAVGLVADLIGRKRPAHAH